MLNKLERVDVIGQKLASRALLADANRGAHLNAFVALNSNEPEKLLGSDYVDAAVCYAWVGNRVLESDDVLVSRVNPMAIDGFNDLVADFGSNSKHRFTRRDLIRFYSWMANYSPWRSAFVTKSGTHMVDKHFVVCRTDRPSNLVIGGLTALRQAWEYTQIVDTWLYLRKNAPELDPAFAYYLGHVFGIVRSPTGDRLEFNDQSNSHTALNSASLTKYGINNFLHGRIESPNDPLPANYRGITNMWGGEEMRGHGWAAMVLRRKMKFAGKVDLSKSLFAWNNMFYVDNDFDENIYLVKDNLPIITELFNRDFGGKE